MMFSFVRQMAHKSFLFCTVSAGTAANFLSASFISTQLEWTDERTTKTEKKETH